MILAVKRDEKYYLLTTKDLITNSFKIKNEAFNEENIAIFELKNTNITFATPLNGLIPDIIRYIDFDIDELDFFSADMIVKRIKSKLDEYCQLVENKIPISFLLIQGDKAYFVESENNIYLIDDYYVLANDDEEGQSDSFGNILRKNEKEILSLVDEVKKYLDFILRIKTPEILIYDTSSKTKMIKNYDK